MTELMRAAVAGRYGPPDVVQVMDVPRPTPRGDEVLVRVHATAVTAADARIRAARFPRGFGPFARLAFGIRRPRRPVLGGVFSGVVETVGSRVTDLAPGDEVCGMTGIRFGTHAEYVVVPAKKVTAKPTGVGHEDAAAVLFGGTTALYFLRDRAELPAGATVLVNGASGAIGTAAVQIARHLGATVTGVTSTPNVALVRKLGAEHVVDYTATPVSALTERYDVVLDTVGNIGPADAGRLLTDSGVLLLAAADLGQTLRARGRVKAGAAPERPSDVAHLVGLVADGHLTAVIDESVSGGLEAIAAAHERVDAGRKVGNIVLRP